MNEPQFNKPATKKKTHWTWWLLLVLVLVILFGAIDTYVLKPTKLKHALEAVQQIEQAKETEKINFAQCLTQKGFYIYTSARNTFTERQKQRFGETAWQYITKVDCDTINCTEQNITGTPIWKWTEYSTFYLLSDRDLDVLEYYAGCGLNITLLGLDPIPVQTPEEIAEIRQSVGLGNAS